MKQLMPLVVILMTLFTGCQNNTPLSQTQKDEKNTLSSTEENTTDVINFYVSTTGSHNASGTIDDPFQSLEDARDASRALPSKAIHIWLRGGVYSLEKTVQFTTADSRTAKTPLTLSGWQDENVTFLGSVLVNNWRKVKSSDAVYNLLREQAKENVLVSNLSEIGITELTEALASTSEYDNGENPHYSNELFIGNSRAKITRYPQEKLIHFTYDGSTIHFNNNSPEVKKVIESWSADKNIYTYGRWNYDWADERNRVIAIDEENSSIILNFQHRYGYRNDSTTKQGIGFYAFNIASSLEESTYYIDYIHKKLYYWPKKSEDSRKYFSRLDTLLSFKDASYITLKNISFAQSKRDAISSEGGSHINIVNCTISNTGGTGIYLFHTNNSKIDGCVVKATGGAGIQVNGGDRPTLTNGNIGTVNK